MTLWAADEGCAKGDPFNPMCGKTLHGYFGDVAYRASLTQGLAKVSGQPCSIECPIVNVTLTGQQGTFKFTTLDIVYEFYSYGRHHSSFKLLFANALFSRVTDQVQQFRGFDL